MRYYHIYPTVPSVLTVGGVTCGMDFVNIECEDDDSFSVTVNPITYGAGFAFMVDKSLSLPKNVRVIALPNSHYDILPSPQAVGEAVRTSVLFGSHRLCASQYDNGELWIGGVRLTLAGAGAAEFSTVTIEGRQILEVSAPSYLALIDSDINLLGQIYGEEIQREGNKIECVRHFNDLAARAEVTRYEIDGTLKMRERFNVYLLGSPKRPEKALYPLAFLQAVLCKDYDEARYYLSSELNEQLSNQDLAEFFPYSDIYPCCYYPDNCIVLLNESGDAKLFKITCNDDCIDNIEELD